MKYLLYFYLTLFSSMALAQRHNQVDFSEFMESQFQIPDEDLDYEALYESLYQLYLDPIDLNKTTREELKRIPILTPIQIESILNYIDQNHPLLSIYELQVIEELSLEEIKGLTPFITVISPNLYQEKGTLAQRVQDNDDNFLLLRSEMILEEQEGFKKHDSVGFLGSRPKLYGRLRSRSPHDYSLGLTFEKDIGEPLRFRPSSNQYGMDFYSAHLMLEDKKRIQKVLIGDYQLQFGEGLILGAGFGIGKGAETITTIHRPNTGIIPYTSVLESGFFRGATMTYELIPSKLKLTPFYSNTRQDATIKTDSSGHNTSYYFSSIQTSGLHRTSTEVRNKNSIKEENYGANLTYQPSRSLTLGATFLNTQYNLPKRPEPNRYNQFEFRESHNYCLGLNTSFNFQNMLLFGEGAISKSTGKAYIVGLMSSLSRELSMSLSIRNYDRNFHSFYGNAFGESSRVINEKGIYWGLKYRINRQLTLSIYHDRFSFPWLRFRVDTPSQGNETQLGIQYRPNKKVTTQLRFREENKERSLANPNNESLTISQNARKRNYIARVNISITKDLSLQTRIQHSSYSLDTRSQGSALTNDITYEIGKFKFSTRYALFDTDDFENRQYIYEKDVLYALSIPAYSGTGTRTYLLVQYKPSRNISCWVKLGRYNYSETDAIGSGNDQIKGHKKTELKVQLRLRM